LDRELAAVHRAGLTAVKRLNQGPWTFFDTGPCLHFPQQGQFHPLKYLRGLAAGIDKRGGRIFSQTHMSKVEGGPPGRVETSDGFSVTADAVVVATNTPVNDLVAVHTKQAAYRTYVIGVRVPSGSVPKALYWDTAQEAGLAEKPGPTAYHYLRLETGALDYDLLLVGGEDHKTGQANDAAQRWAGLETWTRKRFPMSGAIEYRWSGQVMEPIDGLGFIGRNPLDKSNVYIATGDSGNGMTHGTIAGILLTDLIVGRENSWATLYDPSRKTFRAAARFAKENLNVAAQYAQLMTGGDVESVEQIARGSGAVIRRGLKKIAVYRDEQGNLQERSAICFPPRLHRGVERHGEILGLSVSRVSL
jgi:glycine/D-amino acid oxidase-like deaminating enzyme